MTSEQLSELVERVDALAKYLDYNTKKEKVAELEAATAQPEFALASGRAENVMKAIRRLNFWVNGYQDLAREKDDLETIWAFSERGEASEDEVDTEVRKLEQTLEELEFRKMMS